MKNNNTTFDIDKAVVAASALVVMVGSQAVVKDTGKFLSEVVIPHPISKTIIVFCMFFMSTKSWVWAFLCSTLYLVIIRGMLDERHPLSIVVKKPNV